MDLTYLTLRHRAATVMANAAAGPEARCVHRQMAAHYARRIERLRATRLPLAS